MKKKFAIIAIVFALLFGLRLYWSYESVKGDPHAVAGVIDLTRWDGAKDGIVALRGEWTFYPGVLLEPGQPLPAAGERFIDVPGKWDDELGGQRPSTFGYGTYRLVIKLPERHPDLYGLRVERIRTAHKLFVDGKLLAQQGSPGVDRASTTPRVQPYTVSFSPGSSRAEVLIQAANFHYNRLGGIFEDLQFGDRGDILRKSSLEFAGNNLLMGFFAVNGLYFLLLFLFRRRSKELLYFSLMFWAWLVYWAAHGDRTLFLLLPDIDYDWQTKLQMISSIGLFWGMLMFAREMFPGLERPKLTRLAIGISIFAVAFALLTPVYVYSGWEVAFIVFESAEFFYTFLILLFASFRTNVGSVYIYVGALSIMAEGIMQELVFLGLVNVENPFPAERLVFVFSMAILLAKRFFENMQQVEIMTRQLLVTDRLKNDFVANTSQEIRVPLQGMINLAQIMIEDDKLEDERQSERLHLMVATGRQLAQRLNDMMDLLKLNEGDMELRVHTVDVRMTVNGALEVMRFMTSGRDIRFDNQTEAGLPYVKADDQRVLQILFNLLHHAVKSGAEGVVTVSGEWLTEEEAVGVSVVAYRSGEGFDDDVGSEVAADSDIGLVVSRMLTELHGGRFVTSRPSKRHMTFLFTLPIADATETAIPLTLQGETAATLQPMAPPDRTKTKKGEASASGAQRVLIVEDDPVSLQIMQDILAREGMEVTVATDGLQGLKAWERDTEWDLVVLNVMLPRLSGYDLCRKIRERHTFYELPVLFLTSRHQPADLLVGFNAGANDYVIQPINDSEFKARTRTLLRMKQSIRDQLHMEMALIQAQIKPHFLYNTLNTIASLSETDPERTRELLNDFGTYLRSSFDLRNLDRFVAFSKEWALVHSYLQIEQARFGPRMTVTTELPDHPSFSLPPLTIQPIVENALRHGILTRFEGGHLHIAVKEEADGYSISVRDNGVGMTRDKADAVLSGKHRGGIGVVNVHQRLVNAYGVGLRIVSTVGEGTEVSFRIPLAKEE